MIKRRINFQYNYVDYFLMLVFNIDIYLLNLRQVYELIGYSF